MENPPKFVHTNLIAENWQLLATFYQQVFGCKPIPPKRDFKGEILEKGTKILGAHLSGIHLQLPGYEDGTGPTLELFSYQPKLERKPHEINRPGYSHIAFLVDDVEGYQKKVIMAGGQPVGEIVTMQIATGECVTWCYVTDPEGNIIELQSWQ